MLSCTRCLTQQLLIIRWHVCCGAWASKTSNWHSPLCRRCWQLLQSPKSIFDPLEANILVQWLPDLWPSHCHPQAFKVGAWGTERTSRKLSAKLPMNWTMSGQSESFVRPAPNSRSKVAVFLEQFYFPKVRIKS